MNDKQIEIVEGQDPYTRVLRSLILDESLRLQTRMVLIMMLSVPPNWDFSIRGMAKIAHVTKDTMSKMLTELEAAGYVKRKAQERGDGGQFAKAGYLVSGKPVFLQEAETGHKNYDTAQPCHNSPYTAEPYTKNSPQLNNKQLTTEQLSTPCSPPAGGGAGADKPERKGRKGRRKKSVPEHKPERFEQFWAAYPGGGSRLKAVEAWDALAPDDELINEMARALRRQMNSRQWREGIGIPHACRWLSNRRWTDKLPETPPDRKSPGGWADDPEVTS